MKQTITERLDEWEQRRKCCFELFEDYRKGLLDYANWMEAWRERQQKLKNEN